jgi:hypothetical protein
MKRICICGGGSLGHVIAGYLSAKKDLEVNILTQRPQLWKHELQISTPEGDTLCGKLNTVSDKPEEALHEVDIVLLCLPGYAIKSELLKIKPYVNERTYVGTVFSSTGFFFEALEILDNDVPLWGFQRVPFIARTNVYGESAHLLGYKNSHNIAVEHCEDKERFRSQIEKLFDAPVHLLNNYYEASFTNSNPILHPSRLYTLFKDWNKNVYYDHQFLFYEEWTNEASELLITLDKELFSVLAKLPVAPDFLMPILPYYESTDAESLTRKIRSINGFKGITTPMIFSEKGWQPDLNSRYFREDFMHGLRYIHQEAHNLGIEVPMMNKVYNWGVEVTR